MNGGNVYNTPRDYDDIRLHSFLYQSEPIDHSTINPDCNSNQMTETSSVQTKRNRKQYSTVKLIKYVHQFKFLNVKIEKFVGGNLRQSFAFLVSGMLGGGI